MTTAPTTPRLAENRERGSHSVQRLVPHHGRKHLDLFSGIGGFALAAQRAGFQTIGFSEIEPYACSILKQHWPDVPNHGDIRNIKGVRADLITGGFPCQPYSSAGKRRGASDDRALWPEMCRVIAEARPTWVLGENVPGIIGMELDRVLSDLENLGYAAWPLVIPACAADAAHRRDRVWILAADANRQPSAEQKREYQRAENNGGSGATDWMPGRMWSTPTVRDSNTLAKVSRGKGSLAKGNQLIEPLPVQCGGTLNPEWVEWLMGYPKDWTVLKDSATPSCRKSPPKSSRR